MRQSPAMTGPLVSIVTPCFRQGHLLAQAIDSVLAQTFADLELIVVNDGSDDDTDSVARRYAGAIRYVVKANGGLPAARNTGLAMARGRYALFLDADDLLPRDAVALHVEAMAGRADVLSVGGSQLFETDPAVDAAPPRLPTVDAVPLRTYIQWGLQPPHAYLAPVDRLRELGGFSIALDSCEDWECWMRLLLRGVTLQTTQHVVAYYRNTPESMSKNASRMIVARTLVLLTAHDAVMRAPRLLAEVGGDLLSAERRVLRRLLARRVDAPVVVARLRASMRQLHRAGFRETSSPLKKLADLLLGTRAEDLSVAAFRLVSPSSIRYYLEDWN